MTLRDAPLFATVIPSKIFEIMAMARPMLSSVQGESRRILEAARSAEFVESESPAQMAEAVLRLRRNRQKLNEMGLNGRAFVEQHYPRERSADELLRVLRKIC